MEPLTIEAMLALTSGFSAILLSGSIRKGFVFGEDRVLKMEINLMMF